LTVVHGFALDGDEFPEVGDHVALVNDGCRSSPS
jgi:hypothetical protein